MLKCLKPIIEEKNIIPEHQFGFRKQSSIDQVHHKVTNMISKALEESLAKGFLIKLSNQLPHNWCALLELYFTAVNFKPYTKKR